MKFWEKFGNKSFETFFDLFCLHACSRTSKFHANYTYFFKTWNLFSFGTDIQEQQLLRRFQNPNFNADWKELFRWLKKFVLSARL